MSEPCRHERERLDMLEEWAVVLAERNAALAAIERVKARCEDADDQRRWLTAFEIRAALEPSS